MGDGALVDADEHLFELRVLVAQLTGAHVLRVIAPVAIGADPDLEQRGFVLLHGSVARCSERADAGARPDKRVAEREVDFFVPARSLPVDETFPGSAGLALLHSRPQLL